MSEYTEEEMDDMTNELEDINSQMSDLMDSAAYHRSEMEDSEGLMDSLTSRREELWEMLGL